MEDKKVTLRLAYNGGSDGHGKVIIKKQSFTGIIPETTKDNLKAAANAIAGMCDNKLMYAETIVTERIN